MIDIQSVIVRGSDPAVLHFPITARLHSFGIGDGYMSIATSATENWPAVSIDEGPPSQSATLWVFLKINDQWYATGAERLRPNQMNGDKPEGSPSDLIGDGWLYDTFRWKEMAFYNPMPGEIIGVMIAAGSTRSDNQTPVRERTNILEIVWPDRIGAHPCMIVWNEKGDVPVPQPPNAGNPGYQDAEMVKWAQEAMKITTDMGMIFVHTGRFIYDACVGPNGNDPMGYNASFTKHIAELKRDSGR